MSSLLAGAKLKTVVDQEDFQELLAAAYFLQQHNDSLRAKDPRLDTAWIFSEISETQSIVRARRLGVAATATTIVERLRKITDAAGVSICIARDEQLDTLAELGPHAIASIASRSLFASERLKSGREFHTSDAQKDVRLDTALCRELNVGSLLAVPIQGSEEIAGLIELRWDKVDAFHDCDVRTCELMAGLVTELLGRGTQAEESVPPSQPGLSSPHSSVSGEITSTTASTASVTFALSENPVASSSQPIDEGPAHEQASPCRVCGRPFVRDEAFCGKCSMPRMAAGAAQDLQSKWASLWFMQQAQDTLNERSPAEALPALNNRAPVIETVRYNRAPVEPEWAGLEWQQKEVERTEKPQPFTPASEIADESIAKSAAQNRFNAENRATSTADLDLPLPSPGAPDLVRDLRQAIQLLRVHFRTHRRTASLVIGSFALALVLGVWGMWPSSSSQQLTWFESLLVELGLAEAPERPPVFAGNPETRVWVDIHTALYYCPGSDLYGKTPGGRFSTQHDAQEDQFESATGSACN